MSFTDDQPVLSRRAALATGAVGVVGMAVGLSGCVVPSSSSSRRMVEPNPIYPRGQRAAAVPARPTVRTVAATSPPPPVAQPLRLSVVPRGAWTRDGVAGNINAMNGISRITVHHAGGNAFWSTDAKATYRMLESIRGGHRSQGWADIGYHFIVDRDGRVLEGRNLRYQGAHVSENNEHNIGVMLLGNFNNQRPATRQLNALNATLNALAAAYRVTGSKIYTHRELKPTACPGSSLQQYMDRIRRDAVLARG